MPTTLTPGDIAFVSIIALNPDTFSFVLLKDIDAGTIINVTDNGWQSSGSFLTGEGVLQYVAPVAQTVGTVITYITNSTTNSPDVGSSPGWTNVSGGISFDLSTSGDSLIAFQGTLTGLDSKTTSISPTLLAAVTLNGSTFDENAVDFNTTALPTGLTVGINAVAVGQLSVESDNSRYTGPTTFTSVAEARTAINTASNWTGSDTNTTNFSGTFSIGATTPAGNLSVTANTGTLTIGTPSAGVSLGGTTSQNIPTPNNSSFLTKIGVATSVNGAEIPAFDPVSKRLFVVAGNTVEFYSLSNTGTLTPVGNLTPGFTPPAGTELIPNSVAVKNGVVAVAYAIKDSITNAQQTGKVAFFNAADGSFISAVDVGALPDMLTFTPDGTKVLVANEGEPNSYGQPNSVDPEGSVSIINIAGGVASATVQTATFTSFNSQIESLKAAGVRITAPGATVAQDLEPEYIAVDPDGLTARITLQENNAIAILDIASATITQILPLGAKNFNLPGNGIDASDQDGGINIGNVPVFGLYQPDAIANFTVNGQTYYITANEGDSRNYPGFNEEIRVGNASYVLDPTVFPNATTLKQNTNLGRLTVTKATGDSDGDRDIDRIEAFGARSFSIWDASGNQVFDSGDQLEQITATKVLTLFNSDDGTAASFDTRSDNKGPEPEGVAVGVINNRTYAFIGLERTGDVIVYDVTNPNQPTFVQYINIPEDVAPEGLTFISAADSPTGKPLLITANEVSKTVAVFEVNEIGSVSSGGSVTLSGGNITLSGGNTTLTLANKAPTDLALSATSVNENVPDNTVIGTLTTIDPDQGDTFTYTLVDETPVDGVNGRDNSAFTISGNSLIIRQSPDFEVKSTYNIGVRTTDKKGLSYTKGFVVKINDIPTQILNPKDDVFNVLGEFSKVKLKVKLTGRNSGLVNELGVFTVDDPNGTINGIDPGAARYTEAALARSKVILSAIANNPNGFNPNNLNRLLEFDSNQNLRFYLVKNSTIDAVKAKITSTSEILFSNSSIQTVTALSGGGFALGWKDGSNNTSSAFNDLVVDIASTSDTSPIGTGLQGAAQAEVIDLRSVNTSVSAQFTVNREAAFNNFVGFYQVADENGGIDTNGDRIADIFVGQAGYTQAAVRGRVAGIDLTVNNQGTATYTGTFGPGAIFAPFMIVNGRPDAILDTNLSNDPAVYFPYLGANADKVDHIRLLGDNVFGFEDLVNGGDQDFNDVIVKVNLSIA